MEEGSIELFKTSIKLNEGTGRGHRLQIFRRDLYENECFIRNLLKRERLLVPECRLEIFD